MGKKNPKQIFSQSNFTVKHLAFQLTYTCVRAHTHLITQPN